MGCKYRIVAFNYPLKSYAEEKQTEWMLIALYHFITLSKKYDGVNLFKRS